MSDGKSEKQKYIDELIRLNKIANKQQIAEFLRHNSYGEKVVYYPYEN